MTFLRRNALVANYQGKQRTLKEISHMTGLKYELLRNRHNKGDRDAKLVRPVEVENSHPKQPKEVIV